MPPMARVGHADSLNPMDLHAPRGAVQYEFGKLALEIALHLEQLQPQHLGVDHDRIGRTGSGREDQIDEVVGLDAGLDPPATAWWRSVAAAALPTPIRSAMRPWTRAARRSAERPSAQSRPLGFSPFIDAVRRPVGPVVFGRLELRTGRVSIWPASAEYLQPFWTHVPDLLRRPYLLPKFPVLGLQR